MLSRGGVCHKRHEFARAVENVVRGGNGLRPSLPAKTVSISLCHASGPARATD